jgi:multidrug efflux pump subunit AcrB
LVTVDINLPLGTKIERTQEVVASIESFIIQELKTNNERAEGVVDWTSFVGKGPKSYDLGYQQAEANSSYAHLLVNTTSSQANYTTIDALDEFCFENFPDADVTVKLLALGGSGGSDVDIRIKGENPEELFSIMEKVKQQIANIPGTKNIGDDWGPRIKKIVIDIDNDKAFRAGVYNQDIALSLRTNMTGFQASEFREDENTIPIIMRSANFSEQDIETIAGLNIFSQSNGKNVPLEQVADIKPGWQFAKIKRRDLYRTMSVTCDVKEGITASEVIAQLEPWLVEESKSWKRGYEYSLGGEAERSAEGIASVVEMLPLSLLLMILLLVIQFNSFRKTFIIFASIPLGITGVVIGLLLANSFFSFFGILGIISLAGIVINDSIVLVDKIDIALASNSYTPQQAVIKASVGKFRPVILTTLTTSLGLIPLWLGGGLLWEPMAISIIFGLLYGTLIILIFVPVLYSLLFRIRWDK